MGKRKQADRAIARNRRAGHDYHLGDSFEAGVALRGWEVKSLRMGKAELADSYVFVKDGEAFLLGARIAPLAAASSHHATEPTRTRKLLLHKRELARILAATQQKGQTCVCTALYWKGHLVKAKIALARGRQARDKREAEKERDWDRQKQRIMRRAGGG